MDNPLILVVEDDKAVKNLITTTLDIEGYRYHTAARGQEALVEAVSQTPDLMLLDLGLPDMDGMEIIKKVRSWSKMPIIIVSARSDDGDKIDALNAGADDYLTKPFNVEELLARLRVSLRRLKDFTEDSQREAVFLNGGLMIDYSSGCVSLDEKELHLTPIEYKLLCLLARNVGKVLTHNFILNNVWKNALDSDVTSLRVYMANLRKKIETDTSHPIYIQTHVGIGYRMLKIE